MRLAGITYESFVDGPGLRIVIFTQGCDLGCPNCQNPSSWDQTGGRVYTVPQIVRLIKNHNSTKGLVRGITFSGGEPTMQAKELAQLAKKIKPLGLDIVTYTGHTYEELQARDDASIHALLAETDYLIDGPYKQELRGLDLRFRGSSNQRIINMGATRYKGQLVLEDFE